MIIELPRKSARQTASSRSVSQVRPIALFCLVFAILYSLGIFWGLPSVINPASDSIAPLGPLNWIAKYRDTAISYIYPPVHQIVLLFFYAIVLGLCKLAGLVGTISKVYPYGFRRPDLVFSSLLVVTNMVAIAMALAILLYMRWFRITARQNTWFAMCFLGLSGVFTYYARVGNMDVPYLFWMFTSLALAWKYLFDRPDLKLLAYAGIAGALAIGTKDQSVGVELGLGLTLLLTAPDGLKESLDFRVRRGGTFGGALLVGYFVSSIAVNPWRWWAHARFVTSNHVLPEFPLSFSGEVHVLTRTMTRMSHILSYEGMLLGAIGIAILMHRRLWRRLMVLWLPPLFYYVMIIMKLRSTEERYLLPLAFFLALCAGVAVGEGLYAMRGRRMALAALAVAFLAVLGDQVIRGFFPVTYCQMFDTKQALARDLPGLVPAGSSILLTKMNSFNLPNSAVYDQYHLMLPAGMTIFPPSANAEHILQPYTAGFDYILSGTTPLTEVWPPTGQVVREWRYPAWIRDNVHVPGVYEFFLCRRPS